MNTLIFLTGSSEKSGACHLHNFIIQINIVSNFQDYSYVCFSLVRGSSGSYLIQMLWVEIPGGRKFLRKLAPRWTIPKKIVLLLLPGRYMHIWSGPTVIWVVCFCAVNYMVNFFKLRIQMHLGLLTLLSLGCQDFSKIPTFPFQAMCLLFKRILRRCFSPFGVLNYWVYYIFRKPSFGKNYLWHLKTPSCVYY